MIPNKLNIRFNFVILMYRLNFHKMNKLFFAITLALFTLGCSESTDHTKLDTTTTQPISKGKKLMETKCNSCHNPSSSMTERLAPPMVAVKKHYLQKYSTKSEFVNHLVDYVSNPSESKSLIPNAIERFNIMPKMNFDKNELKIIAEYIYDNKLEAPDWFAKHEQEMNNDSQPHNYKEKGLKMALQTKKVLGKNLISQINKYGTPAALEFCSLRAIPLVDSMSNVLNVNISRVSDKPRNPNNLAKGNEMNYIVQTKQAITEGKKPNPKIQEIDGKMVG